MSNPLRITSLVAGATLFLAIAKPAACQTAAPSANVGRVSIGAMAGVAVVQSVGGLVGARIAVDASPRVHIIGDGTWMQNTVTRRRLGSATSVADYLQLSQGSASTGTVAEPTWSFAGGAQVTFATHGTTEFYALGLAGAAHVVFQPAFTLSGTDVTTKLPQYGVTLGSDLAGTSTVATYAGGFGVRVPRAAWVFDLGFRVDSVRTPDEPSTVIGVSFGVLRRF